MECQAFGLAVPHPIALGFVSFYIALIMTFSLYTSDPGISARLFLGLDYKILSRILHLGWPVVLGMLSQTAINTVDLLLVGRLPDSIAVNGTAAMLSSLILLWMFGGFLSAISVGTQTLAARRYSEGNLNQAGQVLFNSLLISIASSFFVFIFAETFLPYFLYYLTPNPEVQRVAVSFCRIRFFGLFSMALMASYKSFYDSLGRVRIHMFISIAMNVVNLVLSVALVFGVPSWSIPALQVEGAAYGAVISSFFGLFIMVLISIQKQEQKKYQVYQLKNFDLKVAKQIAFISLFSGLATLILMGGVALFNYIVGIIDLTQGAQAINSASASIIIHIMMLVFMTCLAFGTAVSTLVSQSIGANRPDLAKRYTWQSVLFCAYGMFLVGCIAFCFPRPLLELFLPKDLHDAWLKQLVIETSIPSLRLALGLLSPIAGCALVLTQALYGAGQSKYIMVIEFILHFFVLVPLAWVLGVHFGLGLWGCWASVGIYASLLLILTARRFASGVWQQTKL